MEKNTKKLKRSISNPGQDDSVIKNFKRTKGHHLQNIPLLPADPLLEKLTTIVDPLRESGVDPLSDSETDPLSDNKVDPLRVEVIYRPLKNIFGEDSTSKNQSYQCGVCKKKFLILPKLIDHMNIHLGYKCSYCKETLITSTPVSDHIVLNEEAACLLKKWKEMEKHMCFVDVNTLT